MTWLRALAQRDLRALLALVASFLGAVVLTGFSVWMVWILWRGGWPTATAIARIDKIGTALILVIVIMGITLIGFGLAINRRQLRGKAFGAEFEASGGDDDPPPIPVQVVNPPSEPVPVEAGEGAGR
jgi:TRAP-type C4-dicarboxylate transport system permease small subunit